MTIERPTLVAVDGCTQVPESKTPEDFYRDLEVDVLARTMWGEARGQGTQGLEAVAAVVLNRVQIATARGRYWWGNNIRGCTR